MKKQLQNLMSAKVGIFKTSSGLIEAEMDLKEIFIETQDIYQQNKLTLGICELRNMVSVAYLMIKQSQEYKQNKGVFTIKTTLNNFYETHRAAINRFIDQALKEDIEGGDHSSNACFDNYLKREAVLKVKDNCVIAGITLAQKIFYRYDSSLRIKILAKEGEKLEPGAVAFRVEGSAKSILASERLVLNCMQRMSGIATLSHQLNQMIKHTKCKILDTRKTTPGFRYPEKWAVTIGGGYNHRMGLFDAIMIKDNHIDFVVVYPKLWKKQKLI